MSSFKRTVYGKTKPVKKPKEGLPTKPSPLQLHEVYRAISKSSLGQHIDYLIVAIKWWDVATLYTTAVYQKKDTQVPIATKRNLVNAYEWKSKGIAATTDADRERCFEKAIELFRSYCLPVLNTQSIKGYLIAYRESNRKKQTQVNAIAPRFDPFLTTLQQCFSSCPITFQVVPDIDGNRKPARKLSNDGNKLLYTRQLAVELLKQMHQRGLLTVIVTEANCVAYAMATSAEGESLGPNDSMRLRYYRQLMEDFVKFCEDNPDAPKTLVRNKPRMRQQNTKRTKTKPLHEQSMNEALMQDMMQELPNG